MAARQRERKTEYRQTDSGQEERQTERRNGVIDRYCTVGCEYEER